jgi:hypothetical protein
VTLARWLKNNAKALDVLLNTSLLASSRVETLSRRAGLARREGKRWACVFCAVLNPIVRRLFGQPDHCESAASHQGCIH